MQAMLTAAQRPVLSDVTLTLPGVKGCTPTPYPTLPMAHMRTELIPSIPPTPGPDASRADVYNLVFPPPPRRPRCRPC